MKNSKAILHNIFAYSMHTLSDVYSAHDMKPDEFFREFVKEHFNLFLDQCITEESDVQERIEHAKRLKLHYGEISDAYNNIIDEEITKRNQGGKFTVKNSLPDIDSLPLF